MIEQEGGKQQHADGEQAQPIRTAPETKQPRSSRPKRKKVQSEEELTNLS